MSYMEPEYPEESNAAAKKDYGNWPLIIFVVGTILLMVLAKIFLT